MSQQSVIGMGPKYNEVHSSVGQGWPNFSKENMSLLKIFLYPHVIKKPSWWLTLTVLNNNWN